MSDRKRIRIKNTVLLAVSMMMAIGVGEALLRLYFSDRLVVHKEERSLLYRYDPLLGWFPRADSRNKFTGSRTISVAHNSRGFRDREHVKSNKPGIIFIGDSFVWGYDVEAEERFTEILRPRLPGWEIFNLGVSGYSTDQELILLMEQYDKHRSDIVFLVYCNNDETDNSTNNIGNGAYYKPYYDVSMNSMALKGVPVPRSLSYFARQHPVLVKSYIIRLLFQFFSEPLIKVSNPTAAIIDEINRFVAKKGGRLLVGLEQPNPSLEHFLHFREIPYIQLSTDERFESHGWHWTPEGHTTVASRIYDFITSNGVVETK